jgi:hypothetical protein
VCLERPDVNVVKPYETDLPLAERRPLTEGELLDGAVAVEVGRDVDSPRVRVLLQLYINIVSI